MYEFAQKKGEKVYNHKNISSTFPFDKLKCFFTDRQIEIIIKKYNREKLTKTEGEYYSRTIKKKIQAISNVQLNKIAEQILLL